MTEDSGLGKIHDEHPFIDAVDDRDPVRRFRGRLAAPVTVVTSGSADARAGLTVSSLIVAEGEPAKVYFLVAPTSDLYTAMVDTGAFIVHILEQRLRRLGDVFAGLAPSPGGPFRGLTVEDGPWGPDLVDAESKLRCRYVGATESTHHMLAEGVVESTALHDLQRPLVYFRGRYRRLDL